MTLDIKVTQLLMTKPPIVIIFQCIFNDTVTVEIAFKVLIKRFDGLLHNHIGVVLVAHR
ncbi:hypothetical protein AF72_06420 [Xylella taiwanensis]|uniref:Uncharacterized protein n=1 Tax=Xylella taiwanensis TaxID=1444770 RepID=Z9JKJ9_9GAMM|nr:hypothetical protein AF72_06420 [Xylella taiwanensis]